MIPINTIKEYNIIEYPTRTYKIDWKNKRIVGFTDNLEALKQAVYKLLLTERWDYAIYDGNYGVTLKDLFGRDKYIACAVLERRITDALLNDDRINNVSDFEFKVDKNSVTVAFILKTTYGNLKQEVTINV